MSAPSRLETIALDLIERGYHVFPCRGKVPLTGKGGFHHATTDERQVLTWWASTPHANVGIACGKSAIVVVDIDAKHGADPREVIPELDLEHHPWIVWTGEAPERDDEHPHSLTGERGAHLYFRGDLRGAQTSIRGVETSAT